MGWTLTKNQCELYLISIWGNGIMLPCPKRQFYKLLKLFRARSLSVFFYVFLNHLPCFFPRLVSERKSQFFEKNPENSRIFFEIFFSSWKTHSFPDLLAVIQNYPYKLQISGAPSLWITVLFLSKKRQAASFCCSSNSRKRSLSRMRVPTF